MKWYPVLSAIALATQLAGQEKADCRQPCVDRMRRPPVLRGANRPTV